MKTLRSQTVYFLAAPHPAAALIELFVIIAIGFGLLQLWLLWKRRKKTVEEWEVIIIDSQTDIVTLAEKFGVSWKLMAKVNKLKPPYILRPGDAIRVPAQIASAAAPAPGTDMKIVTVDAPTDITAIAKEHGVSWKTLAKLNKLSAPYILRPGDMIRIPVKADKGKIDKIKHIAKRKPVQRMEPVVVDRHTDIVSFAENYGLEWKELAKINKLKAPYILKPGYVVMVPAGSAPKQVADEGRVLPAQPLMQTSSTVPEVVPTPEPAPAQAFVMPSEAVTVPENIPAPVVQPAFVAPTAPVTPAEPAVSAAPALSAQPHAPVVPVSAPEVTPVVASSPVPTVATAAPSEVIPMVSPVASPEAVPATAPTSAPVIQPAIVPAEPAAPIVYAPSPQPAQESTPKPEPAKVEPPTVEEAVSEPAISPASTVHEAKHDEEPIVHRPKVVKIQDVRKVSPGQHVGRHGRSHGSDDDERPPTAHWPT